MPDKFKNIIKKLLLIFVFVSVGFALGKYSASRKGTSGYSTSKDAVHVYYMHATFRCVTCNTIEKMTKTFLDSRFAEEIKTKKIIFSELNFQENEALAKKFDVVSSCVVVAKETNGEITGFKRLDKVWTLMDKPEEFNAYLSKAIESFMTDKGKDSE
jgi:hypothetical protein